MLKDRSEVLNRDISEKARHSLGNVAIASEGNNDEF